MSGKSSVMYVCYTVVSCSVRRNEIRGNEATRGLDAGCWTRVGRDDHTKSLSLPIAFDCRWPFGATRKEVSATSINFVSNLFENRLAGYLSEEPVLGSSRAPLASGEHVVSGAELSAGCGLLSY